MIKRAKNLKIKNSFNKMGICISMNKNKNKSQKDEVNKNIKMNLDDNINQIFEKTKTINDKLNNVDDLGTEQVKNEFKNHDNNIIISEQNLVSISRKNSEEKVIEEKNNKIKNDNNIIFSISEEFASNPDSKRNIPYTLFNKKNIKKNINIYYQYLYNFLFFQ